ncbi:hypothetical protein HDU67_008167 [Dinochytrium kinnereticum]|nr:hypothetical protein HDU67_008167 [Dinochytrium kinnereticum]
MPAAGVSGHAVILKGAIITGLVAFGGYVVYNVLLSFATLPISEGFERIKASPTALSALFDYIASLSLCATFTATRTSGNPWIAGTQAIAVVMLGNPIMLFAAAYFLMSSKTCREAWLVASSPSSQKNLVGLNLFRVAVVVNLGFYIWSVVRALSMESPSDGWEAIAREPWSYTTFVDSFAGVIFSILYVVSREWGRPIVWGSFVLGLLLLGNGVGCVYVLLATIGQESIRDSMLSNKPISITGTRTEYQRIP